MARLPRVFDHSTRFTLYETRSRFYIIARSLSLRSFRVLRLSRLSLSLDVQEDPSPYSEEDLDHFERSIRRSHQRDGGVVGVVQAEALVGLVRFTLGWYLLVVLSSQRVGRLGPHRVEAVGDTSLVYLPHPSVADRDDLQTVHRTQRGNEQKYKSLFTLLDLVKTFYYSHSYELTRTLQANMLADEGKRVPVRDMYVWNHHMLPAQIVRSVQERRRSGEEDLSCGGKEEQPRHVSSDSPSSNEFHPFASAPGDGDACSFRNPGFKPSLSSGSLRPEEAVDTCILHSEGWFVRLVHGSFEQRTLSLFGRPLTLTLIARRSRHFAGTRYLKRGVNSSGHAANDVETEQILHDVSHGDPHDGSFVSHVSMRGSIPLHWTQEGNAIIAQPAIVIQRPDPFHQSTRAHLIDLWERYNSPILVLNLVKQQERRKRESIIGTAWGEAIDALNHFIDPEHHIDYLAFDFKRTAQSKQLNVMDELKVIAHWTVQRTGVFCSQANSSIQPCLALKTMQIKPTRSSLQECGVRGLPPVRYDISSFSKATLADEEPCTASSAGTTETFSARSSSNTTFIFDEWHGGDRSGNSGRSANSSTVNTPSSSSLWCPDEVQGQEPESAQSVRGGNLFSIRSICSSHAFEQTSLSSFDHRNSVDDLSSFFQAVDVAVVQRGVCRVNCVDSLDRTNVAAYCIGRCALGYQLHALHLSESPDLDTVIDPLSSLHAVLLAMYERMGDAIALQYGGSQMHRQVKKGSASSTKASNNGQTILSPREANQTNGGKRSISSTAASLFNTFKPSAQQPKELFVSLMRHYQNSFQDTAKQDAINLFLGLFHPSLAKDGSHLWDMPSDYYLHNEPMDVHPWRIQRRDRALCDMQDGVGFVHGLSDRKWWQEPILRNEQSLGVFALPPWAIFSKPPHVNTYPFTPLFSSSAARDVSFHGVENVDTSPSSTDAVTELSTSSLPSNLLVTSSANEDERPSNYMQMAPQTLSLPQLRLIACHGHPTLLSEFDSLLKASPDVQVHIVNILGQADVLVLSSPTNNRGSVTKASSSSKHQIDKRGYESQIERNEDSELDPKLEELLFVLENERKIGYEQSERLRLSQIYALDSAYAYSTAQPAQPAAAMYSEYLSLMPEQLLEPEEIVEKTFERQEIVSNTSSSFVSNVRDHRYVKRNSHMLESRMLMENGESNRYIELPCSFSRGSKSRLDLGSFLSSSKIPDAVSSLVNGQSNGRSDSAFPPITHSVAVEAASERTKEFDMLAKSSSAPARQVVDLDKVKIDQQKRVALAVSDWLLPHSRSIRLEYYTAYCGNETIIDALWYTCFQSFDLECSVVSTSNINGPLAFHAERDFELFEKYVQAR